MHFIWHYRFTIICIKRIIRNSVCRWRAMSGDCQKPCMMKTYFNPISSFESRLCPVLEAGSAPRGFHSAQPPLELIWLLLTVVWFLLDRRLVILPSANWEMRQLPFFLSYLSRRVWAISASRSHSGFWGLAQPALLALPLVFVKPGKVLDFPVVHGGYGAVWAGTWALCPCS